MLETVTIPVLMKAVDFLFEEGKKILEERRARRMSREEPLPETAAGNASERDTTALNSAIQTKEIALHTSVDKTLWQESEKKVKHLLSLLETYQTNYYLAKEQYAKYGSADVRPIIVHTLTEAEDGIARTMKELQAVLTQVYEKQVVVDEEL